MKKNIHAIIISSLIALSLNANTTEAVRLVNKPEPAPVVESTTPSTPSEPVTAEKSTEANFTVDDFLHKMTGEWYDVRNYKTITIATDIPSINGCPIISFDATGTLDNGTATVELKEDTGKKLLKLNWTMDNDNRLNSCIKVDGKPTYRHAAGNIVSETLATYKLWMTEGDVRVKASSPGEHMTAAATEEKTGIKQDGWYFEDGIIFTYNPKSMILDNIVLLNDCDLTLDKSHLNCKSTLEEFAKFYGWKKVPKIGDVMPLDKEMYISFKNYPNSIALTIYPK